MNFVFVHLGEAESPTSLHHVRIFEKLRIATKDFLVNDRTTEWRTFPGDVLTFSKMSLLEKLRTLERKFQAFERIARGYSLHTLNQLFALSDVYEMVERDASIANVDSDLSPLFGSDVIKWIESAMTKGVHLKKVSFADRIRLMQYYGLRRKLSVRLHRMRSMQ